MTRRRIASFIKVPANTVTGHDKLSGKLQQAELHYGLTIEEAGEAFRLRSHDEHQLRVSTK